MGTRADFYVGRGSEAEWLGSIAWDGYEIGDVATAETEADYRERLTRFLASRDDATLPEDGWPWPWTTSHTTDYAYAFDGDRVWASRFGEEWWPAAEDEPETYDEAADEEIERPKLPADGHPDMTSRQNVTLGGRSGLLILGAQKEEE